MMTVKTYVAPSGIQGNGLYAGEDIKQGQVIWEFIPKFDVEFALADIAAMPELAQAYLERYTYPHPRKDGVRILDGDGGRFMNHSATPNTDFSTPDSGTARVDIPAGTELVCDYNEFSGEIDF